MERKEAYLEQLRKENPQMFSWIQETLHVDRVNSLEALTRDPETRGWRINQSLLLENSNAFKNLNSRCYALEPAKHGMNTAAKVHLIQWKKELGTDRFLVLALRNPNTGVYKGGEWIIQPVPVDLLVMDFAKLMAAYYRAGPEEIEQNRPRYLAAMIARTEGFQPIKYVGNDGHVLTERPG